MLLHGGDCYRAARLVGCAPAEILDFSSGTNPLGPAPGVIAAAQAALDAVSHAPPRRAQPLRSHLAAQLGCDVAVGGGAEALLRVALLGAHHVWVAPPSGPDCVAAVHAARAALVEHMHAADVLVFGRPSALDGAMPATEELHAIAEAWPACLVIVDESLLGLTAASSSLCPDAPSNLWVLTDAARQWAVPGLRLGWLAGRDVSRAAALLPPVSVSTAAIAAGLAGLEQAAWLRNCARQLASWRSALRAELLQLPGVVQVTGDATVLLVTLESPHAPALTGALLRQGRVLIRDVSGATGLDGRHVQVSVRMPGDNQRLLEAWRALS